MVSPTTLAGDDVQGSSLQVEDVEPSVRPDDAVRILCEFVGANHLMKEDFELLKSRDQQDESDGVHSMRPFGVVHYGGECIHKTGKSLEKGRNPVWTISTRALFILETTPRELSRHKLEFSLWANKKERLALSSEAILLGKVRLESKELLTNCNETRLTMKLFDEDGSNSNRGTLTIRFRPAVISDEMFLQNVYRNNPFPAKQSMAFLQNLYTKPFSLTEKEASCETRMLAPLTTEMDESQIAGLSFVNALSSAFSSKSYRDVATNQQKYRLKPGPDPARPEVTHLSKDEIFAETMKPSKEWVKAGSGTLGKLYLEILHCSDLPNTDVGESVGNLTDSFIAAVFEDCMVQTPVIDDELSPRWLPWTQRAFIFGVQHPASTLYLGCFDFDLGMSDHESIGRVAVNLCNFERNTDYTLRYHLYQSSNVMERKPNGSITIRLRLEYADEKSAVMAALKPRPRFHVNVRAKKSQQVLHYTCFGAYGDEREAKFDLTITRSYINEILENKRLLLYALSDSIYSLIFWRGQVKIFGLNTPLHSFFFFVSAATLVERPEMFPAFLFLSVAWVMLACGTQRRSHPSPWARCPSFWHFVEILKSGTSSHRETTIHSMEGNKESSEYESYWRDRIQKDIDAATLKAEQRQLLTKLGSGDIHTKMNAEDFIPLELLSKLGRWQGMIGRFCMRCRWIKVVATWEESIVSFWVTSGFLAIGIISLFLPWGFILTTMGRTLVYSLGPHMMLVDHYFNRGSDEDDKLLQKAMSKLNKMTQRAQERHQEATKLKDIKCTLFGKYITAVPAMNLSRHFDKPLPESFATPHKRSKDEVIVSKSFVPGQQFHGLMIPRLEEASEGFEIEKRGAEQIAPAALKCIESILQQRLREQLDRYDSAQEAMLPQSLGYELVNLGTYSGGEVNDSNEPQMRRSSQRPIALTASTSVEVDEDAKVAVLCVKRRRSSALASSGRWGNGKRESVRFGYEVLHFDSNEEVEYESSVRLSEANMLEVRRSQKMAIVDNLWEENDTIDASMRSRKKKEMRPTGRKSVSFTMTMDPFEVLGNDFDCNMSLDSSIDASCISGNCVDQVSSQNSPNAFDSDSDGIEVVLQKVSTMVEDLSDEEKDCTSFKELSQCESNSGDQYIIAANDEDVALAPSEDTQVNACAKRPVCSPKTKVRHSKVHVVLYKQD